MSVTGGQALSAIRLDFSDAMAPPTSRTLLQGPVFINMAYRVALGTPLSAQFRAVYLVVMTLHCLA
jgi:hypothetical protein